jgi:hypothetical protein
MSGFSCSCRGAISGLQLPQVRQQRGTRAAAVRSKTYELSTEACGDPLASPLDETCRSRTAAITLAVDTGDDKSGPSGTDVGRKHRDEQRTESGCCRPGLTGDAGWNLKRLNH